MAQKITQLGEAVLTQGARDRLIIQSPLDLKTLGWVPRCTPEDVREAARRAREAQVEWARWPVEKRAAILLRFHDLVLERQEEALDLIQLENGKARRHAFEEVLDVVINARYYGHVASKALKPKRRQGAFPILTEAWEYHHPKGVVGIISPWNYPLTLGISDALPAIAAGNAVLAKPDERTPFSALWAVQLLEEAGLPRGVIQTVTGYGAELGASIIEHSDFLMFTGSTRVGKIVAQQAAARLIDYSMELGGKNALLLLEDVDLSQAVQGALRASFSSSGQLCISAERIYVPSKIWDQFVPAFVEATRALKLAQAMDYEPEMGSLISQKHLETIESHVNDALAKGARALAGGRARPDLGPCFYEPTILTDVTPEMKAFAEETFGPVVSLYRVERAEEAILKANDSPYGLNFSVWTRNPRRGREVAAKLEAGTVNVNEAYASAWASVDSPMGGFKQSGVGRRHGEEGILKYTNSQTIAVQKYLPLAPPSFMSAAQYARWVSRALRLVRYLPWRR
jgi:succinate-semialdehyde dehydrogenase/glutarate-semialdehyde dehydrogenase